MDLELLEKFLLEFVAPEAKGAINNVFKGIRQETIPVILQGLASLQEMTKKKDHESHVAAVNGIIVGVSICYGLHRCPEFRPVLEGYIAQNQKARGENVLDIFQAKAGK